MTIKIFNILVIVFLFGCSPEKQYIHTSITNPETCGESVVQLDESDRSSFFNKLHKDIGLTELEKNLISEELKNVNYTHLKVRKFDFEGRTWLFVYGDCYDNPNQGYGHSTLYEFQNDKWESVQHTLYD